MYADDIVLLAENSDDLQLLLNSLNDWCGINSMNINGSKSNIVHFRTHSQAKTTHVFKCGEIVLDIADRYKYLGVILQENEHNSKGSCPKCKSCVRPISCPFKINRWSSL